MSEFIPSLEDNSRLIHSSNLNDRRIANEDAEILHKQNVRKFRSIEIELYQKFDNAEIMTYDELEAQINAAYQKIMCGDIRN